MKTANNLIEIYCNKTKDKNLIGKKCVIKPEILQQYINNGCKAHADLCEGVLTIVETQIGFGGKFLVRIQNDRIKNIHPNGGDFLNSFPKRLEEITILED